MTQATGVRVPARTILVDDHPLFRIGLREVLERQASGIEIVHDVGSASEALTYVTTQPVDLAIVDIILPEISGVVLASELRRVRPKCKILGLSMLDDPTKIAEILRAGADGFALKTQPPEALIEAARLVLGGIRYLPPSVPSHEIDAIGEDPSAWPLDRLTIREREVFELLVHGHSNDAIATRLFIARRTVEAHRMHIMHKLAARSVVDLVRLAWRHGVAGA